jgi:catechol 2,3-dioxygenase-like lactoylglutathione lyase family enzyme
MPDGPSPRPEDVRFISGVILVSREPERSAGFYRDVLGLPLAEERHGDTQPHWGCELGETHFAIHPAEDYPEDPVTGPSPVKFAFMVFDLPKMISWLDKCGVPLCYPPASLGGAVTQILLDRGLGAAGVAIDSAPVKGVLRLPLSTLRVSYVALRNPANLRRPVSLTAAQFHYAFTNTLSRTQSDAVYRRYCVPGPARTVFQAAFANFAPHAAITVNFRSNERAPLLLIAGGRDHFAPAAVTRSNFKSYRHSRAVTDFVEYPGRSHYTLGQDGWEAVADYALNWATSQIAAHRA